MIKACVIGWPIAHSRSPLIHNYWLRQLGLAGSYERVAVEPQNLHAFLRNLKANGYAGCNVTFPHKESAIKAMDVIDGSVKTIGALNTVYMRGGKTHATSTDGEGFYQNLFSTFPDFEIKDKNVTILGAGGSARAIIQHLLFESVGSITLVNRTGQRANELKSAFGDKVFVGGTTSNCDLLVNTTPLGMTGQPALDIDLSILPDHAIVADIVYVPLKTGFLKRAEARGLRIVPGLGMLLHQAVRGFELWYGQKPVVTADLHDLIARDIDPDYRP